MLTVSSAYVSDVISCKNRATVLSLNLAGTAVAFTVAPVAAGLLPVLASAWLATGLALLAAALLAAFAPESVSPAAKKQVSSSIISEARGDFNQ